MIYLDNSATTKVIPEVVDVMTDIMKNMYGNPSSLHGLGVKAERLIETSRKILAQELGAQPQEIVFTSGGTEANNLAIRGTIESYGHRGKHIITTMIEHPSVYDLFQKYEQEGWQVTYLPVDQQGKVNLAALKQALTKDTVLVSVMHVNNETGVIQPVEQIGEILKQYPKTLFHVDAVQSFGRLPLHPVKHQIDLLTFSGHKIHGPKGIGALYIQKNRRIAPMLIGGGQEYDLRSGTQNVPGIAGLAKALLWIKQKRVARLPAMESWKQAFLKSIEQIPLVKVNGAINRIDSVPYIINLSFPGLKSEVVVHALEAENCYVSSRSACSSRTEKVSRVLQAMGASDQQAIGSIRISLGFLSEADDLNRLSQRLCKVIPQLQRVMKV
ncbi:cysteine desulfurase [Seinonella peptonophila]|uniref:Cysteine desulfurase n=1 Tax=Seinonella peptonophila TaxID=112248 RepID=A0A1M4V5A9_9BACL|nr:cysteine desulfurase family protein [Seinonella peptonophila]SHE64087.1 cysteine desulfurase [Seinonella peptonophila]